MTTTIMKRRFRVAFAALAFGVAACGAEAAILGPLVILTNQWKDEANASHTFLIQDNTGFQAKRSGTFTGTERLANGTSFALEGSWSDNGSIQFTVHRSPDVTWRGTLGSNTDRLQFTSGSSNLVLLRN